MDTYKPTLAIYGIQDCNLFQTYSHDHNMCLMQDGEVLDFVQLERITRVKRDNSMNKHLDELLRSKKWINKDFDLVFVDNVLGRAFINIQGNVRFEASIQSELNKTPEEGHCFWYGKPHKAYVLNHELAHIGTCLPFFGAYKENSLLVHFDGGASQSCFSAWLYKGDELNLLEAHWDYKWLSSIFNANAFVFSVIGAKLKDQNSVPGKMMGLAGHGNYDIRIEQWFKHHNFFENIWRRPSLFFDRIKQDFAINIKSFDQHHYFIQNCIATLHEMFVRETIAIFRNLESKTNADYLYYSGGSALNIITNTRLIESKTFQDVFIPPCCEDSGLALGAAAFVEWIKHGNVQMHSPYLNNWGISTSESPLVHTPIKEVADKLARNEILALWQGAGEVGPRALGNRSLLARADSKQLMQKLSMNIKKREWYRPLAPIMLKKNAQYFTGKQNIHHLSRYMLLDFPILDEHRLELEGACNADGSARIQCLFDRSQNPYMWDLLTELDSTHGIKALINTSFNEQGEPIVHSISDAQKTAQKLGVELVIGF
ncbi:MAG: carbamoyltransferase C-terminal domain-containing protein [Mangrovibacterium sp.]